MRKQPDRPDEYRKRQPDEQRIADCGSNSDTRAVAHSDAVT